MVYGLPQNHVSSLSVNIVSAISWCHAGGNGYYHLLICVVAKCPYMEDFLVGGLSEGV